MSPSVTTTGLIYSLSFVMTHRLKITGMDKLSRHLLCNCLKSEEWKEAGWNSEQE
jgi:hypothetical protein